MQIRRKLQLIAAAVIVNGLIALGLSPNVALANPCATQSFCGFCSSLSFCQSVAKSGCTATSFPCAPVACGSGPRILKLKWDHVLTATLILCALVTTGLVVRREFFAPPMLSAGDPPRKPVFIEGWRSELGTGERLGPKDASVQLIEFADFECPFCGDFHRNLQVLQNRYPTQVAVTYVHFPLQGHRFAFPAARVAECAHEQGKFAAMHDQLFARQDEFGLKPWSDYAIAAGVPDLAAFDACIKKTDPIPRVEQGKALGAKLNVQGTPTTIINGWKLGRPPTEDELDGMVRKILAGNNPVP